MSSLYGDGEFRKPSVPITDKSLHVKISREPFLAWFKLILPNGQTEELDPDETREWFKVRGANMIALDKALDYCWNFYNSEFVIQNPKTPNVLNHNIAPQVDGMI